MRNIRSNKIDIKDNNWQIYDAKIYENNIGKDVEVLEFYSNFNQKVIETLFSNLSSLSILKLFDLRTNYISLNYSVIDIDIQIQKILTYPIFLMLMTIFAAIIMFNTRSFKSNIIKIVIGLFFLY